MLVLVLSALLGAPWRALHGAPLAELSGDQDFQLFLHKNLEFTRKIKGDVAALQRVVVSCWHRGVADKVTFPSLALSAPRGREPEASPRPNLPTPRPPPPPGLRHPRGLPRGGVGTSPCAERAAVPPRPLDAQKRCDTFQLCKEEELLLVQQDLRITQVALEQCHRPSFQAEACFSQIRDGLHAYHSSLAAVLELLPSHAGLVETLQLDAANLSSNIQQQVRGGRGGGHDEGGLHPWGGVAQGHGAPMEDLGLATVTFPAEDRGPLPAFSSRFQHQVGGFLILANFQRFLETAYRALRHLARL
ncbi:Granulocyte colony-stimulating factor [Aix galericulata]|nr:Granulocyte colony-stimulating factor [Aix galericulata]